LIPTPQACVARLSAVNETGSMNPDKDLQRRWERIASEVSRETDKKKLIKLTKELVRALHEWRTPRRNNQNE
jgi:hypothetical protein